MRTEFVWILSVEISKQILSIDNMLDGFPSAFAQTITEPIDQVIKFVANKFGIEDGSNFILQASVQLQRGRRWCNTIGNGVCFIRFKKRTMENRMYLKLRREIKAECDIINFTRNTERTESSIIQLVARSSSLDVTTPMAKEEGSR